MVVKEDGSKWACQSCLKGHRVSGCTHTDRELTLVPKKGRPVTQCQHCRLERKKRSAHVKCDCGETDKPHHSKEKCIHLREAEERAKAGLHEDHPLGTDASYLAAVAEEQGCCCHHGGKCTCAILKKDVEENAAAPHGPAVKPRLEKATSDGAVTVFTNGHHKPVHRRNHAAHECGMPYKIPAQRPSLDSSVSATARRSADSLTLGRSVSQCSGTTFSINVPFNTERRQSKSEQHSPKMSPLSENWNGLTDSKPMSMDFSTLVPMQTNSSMNSYASESFASPLDTMSGATDSSFDPWSAFPSADPGFMPNNNPFGVWPTQSDNHDISQPALTAASSGTQSEIDEIPPLDEAYGYHMPSIQEDANSDIVSMPLEANTPANRRSLPPGFFGNTDFDMTVQYSSWPTTMDGSGAADRSKSLQDASVTNPDDVWQMSSLSPIMTVPQRALGGYPYSSRPQSRSVGSTSAPNDDIIKQLFPDLDTGGGPFGSNGSPQMSSDTIMGGVPRSSDASGPFEYGPMDEDVNFTSQQWSDGSMTVPTDTYSTSYDLDADFSNPDFSGDWSQ